MDGELKRAERAGLRFPTGECDAQKNNCILNFEDDEAEE